MNNIAATPNEIPEEGATQSKITTSKGSLPGDKTKNAPFTLFVQDNQMPFTAKFFGLDKPGFEGLAQADINQTVPKMMAIEQYVQDKIVNEQYFDSTETFTQIIDNIREVLGIQKFEPMAKQVDKIARYLNEGKPVAAEFTVKRSSKADELDHARNQKVTAARQQPQFRKMDNLFSKFFNR